MEITNKKNHLSHIRISFIFIMLLLAMGLTMNVLFCSAHNDYETTVQTTVIETWTIAESIIVNENGDNTINSKVSFSNTNNSYDDTTTNSIGSVFMLAAIPYGFSLLLFRIIVFLFYFSTLFILLPDGWTLINQKVRLDN